MGVDLADIKGFPECATCGGRKWVVVGDVEHDGRTVPLEEPCEDCVPRLNLNDKETDE